LFIRKKVEMLIRLTGFPLKTCGNDKQKQPFKDCHPRAWPGDPGCFQLKYERPI